MFLRPRAARLTGFSKRVQANKSGDFIGPIGSMDTFVTFLTDTPGDVSRIFYERLKIVLDRLRFNRIISHTQG